MIVFPETVAAGHFLAARHEMRQDLVYRVLVEEPLVDGLGFDAVGHFPVFAPFLCIPLFFLFLREVVVFDAFPLELERNGDRLHRNEESVLHGIVQRVSVRGTPSASSKREYVLWSISSLGVAVRPTR